MREQQSVGELLQELTDSSRELIRQEIRLARAEIQASMDEGRRGLTWLIVAMVPALMAAVVAPLAVVWGIDAFMPRWVAAAIVAVVLLCVAGILAIAGRRHIKQAEPPRRTVDTVKEDARWLKNRLS